MCSCVCVCLSLSAPGVSAPPPQPCGVCTKAVNQNTCGSAGYISVRPGDTCASIISKSFWGNASRLAAANAGLRCCDDALTVGDRICLWGADPVPPGTALSVHWHLACLQCALGFGMPQAGSCFPARTHTRLSGTFLIAIELGFEALELARGAGQRGAAFVCLLACLLRPTHLRLCILATLGVAAPGKSPCAKYKKGDNPCRVGTCIPVDGYQYKCECPKGYKATRLKSGDLICQKGQRGA